MATIKSSEVTAMRPGTHPPKYDRLIALAKQMPPVATIVVHPCDETSLRGAVEAAEAGIIIPTLLDRWQRLPPWRASITWISAASRLSTCRIAMRPQRRLSR